MCFLEAARQLSEVDRERGVLILKIWHSYFDQYETEMEKMVQSVFQKQRGIDATLATIKTSVMEIMTQKEDLEHQFFDLNKRIDVLQKDLNLSRMIQAKETAAKIDAQTRYDKIQKLLPRYEQYADKIEMLPMISDTQRLQFLLNVLQKSMPDSTELPLVQDLDNILESIRSEPTSQLEQRYSLKLVKDEFYNFKKEAESKIKEQNERIIDLMTLLREASMGDKDTNDAICQTEI